MAALIVFKPGVDWTTTGGLFDWTLEFLMRRVPHQEVVDHLREIVDNNLGSFWLDDVPARYRAEILTRLRQELLAAAERELPDTDQKPAALGHLRELVDAACRVDSSG